MDNFLSSLSNYINEVVRGKKVRIVGRDAQWRKVAEIKVGDKIAVFGDNVFFDEIVSIKRLSPERVYDIEVEGTHNFVAGHFINLPSPETEAILTDEPSRAPPGDLTMKQFNSKVFGGIIAHNTYISGNVGIGTTGPDNLLELYKSQNVTANNTNIYPLKITSFDSSGGLWTNQSAGIQFEVGAQSTTPGVVAEIISHPNAADPTNGWLKFGTNTAGTMSTKMSIDYSGNVGIGTTAPGADLDVAGRTIKLSNFYPEYRWYFGGSTDLNWKKIADVTFGTGAYRAASFQIDILNAGSNFGSSSNEIPLRYYVTAYRSGATPDTPDSGSVAGPIADYVRLVKTALGVYELQVRQISSWRHMEVTVHTTSSSGASITYVTTPADGSTTGTNYDASVTGYTQNFPNVTANGTLDANGVVTLGDNGDNITINSNVWDVTAAGVASGLTGITSSGTINFSGLTASRLVTTDASKNLASTITLANVVSSISDVSGSTGTTNLVLSASPTFTGNVTMPGTGIWNSSGNVGIGTTTPGYALEVAGQSSGNGSIAADYLLDLGSTSYGIDPGGTANPNLPAGYSLKITGGALLAYNSGNVGIGATAPLSKLGVLGNLSVGATYGALAAPTSGAIFEGNVGIGTTAKISSFGEPV